jgi:16S rRNA (adenine1518-N6/adenine1519-N6)-dimethyltransferase
MIRTPAWEDPRKVLARRGLVPKRAFSQNFLVSQRIIDAIAAAAFSRPTEHVVELGAGLGTLTAALVRVGARVIAIERDRELISILREEFAPYPAVQIVAGDATTIDLRPWAEACGQRLALAGNIPYAATGAIIKHLVASREYLARAVLTVQREVGDRLRAEAGSKSYGALTVFTSAAFQVETLMRVPASAFHPRPKVDSSVMSFVPHAVARAEETEAFRFLVHAAFQQRRKTLRNALRSAAPSAVATRIDSALALASIDGGRRGETLTVEEFARLATLWQSVDLPLL